MPFRFAAVLAFLSVSCAGIAAADEAGEVERPVFDFSDASQADRWITINDTVMGGVSSSSVAMTEAETLAFTGVVSLENNGGFTSTRTRRIDFSDLSGNADAIRFRTRGDGRTYWFTFEPGRRGMGGMYRATFKAPVGEWSDVTIPIAKFQATVFGEVIPGARPIAPDAIRTMGVLLYDKKPGAFAMEIDDIRFVESGRATAEPSSDAIMLAELDITARDIALAAIERGVPLFNEGQEDACAAVYEVAVIGMLASNDASLTKDERAVLGQSLVSARQERDGAERAWLYRRAMDAVIE